MKQLSVAVAFAAVTVAAFVCRDAFRQPVEAAREPEQASRVDRALGITRAPAPAGALRVVALAAAGDPSDAGTDRLLAVLAAESGHLLFDRASKQPNSPHLLNQAALHYRACLAHEPTTPGAEGLFRDVRQKLAQVERLQARARPAVTPPPAAPRKAEPPAAPPPPPPSAVVPAPAATKDSVEAKKDSAETRMVGPDGVTYRRLDD
jgi:hypothetical protein